jgi:hypothetical protein
VANFKANLGASLKLLGVRRARIAFDADWRSKKEVGSQFERLGRTLLIDGLTVSWLDWSWNDGKGLDDLLSREVA